ncbi:MAG: SUMF1/EgtB/PvdO family nonheme iron enzyme [Treponema sp.]|nr:SUMF1/EgtB/PvdO family nonheme iron enzyme [Treponema sp.]
MTKLQLNLARTYEERGYDAALNFWTEKQDEIKSLSEKERDTITKMMERYCMINNDAGIAQSFSTGYGGNYAKNKEFESMILEWGRMYKSGNKIPQDYKKAAECFQRLSFSGNKLAQFMLGEMYMRGLGVEKSRTEAEKWYISANAEKERYTTGLVHMTIPDGIECIEDYVFEGFDSLCSVIIPDIVKRIGDGAFKDCRNLESVKFSSDSTVIGFKAFDNCPLNEMAKQLVGQTGFVLIKGAGDIKDFYIGRFPVTQDLYEEIMGENPSYFKGTRHPVDSVSWNDAIYFCNKMSEKLGLLPVYSVNGQTAPEYWGYTPHESLRVFESIKQNFLANGFRLPTASEWEFAAKGGQNYEYARSDILDEVGWYNANSGDKSHPVAEKKPNDYGLYDMLGNVWEFVHDDYDSCSARGGCYGSSSLDCKIARKTSSFKQRSSVGFRIVRNAD